MSDLAIKVEGLSKLYRIGQREPYRTLRDTITNAFTAPVRWVRNSQSAIRNPNGLSNPHSEIRNPKSDTIWALKDVSFEVKHGEVIGVIGRNGAGKSTLLKILSRITEPTEGYADIYGRVGSLLEVGTGFHPELTGRENIFLNGAILGMKKQEINRKFDEIVAFAEVEKFIDTPVKHYSSGMHMRLAFSVAAHLGSEILLVDEVLAVGDAAFQQKCITKMGDASHQGRTILFVSHNMGAIGRLCQRCLLLEEGRIFTFGEASKAIAVYLQGIGNGGAELLFAPDEEKTMQIRAIRLLDHEGHPSTIFDRSLPFRVEMEYDVRKPVLGAYVAVTLDGSDGTVILSSADIDAVPRGLVQREVGTYLSTVEFPGGIFNAGTCVVRVGIARYGGAVYDYHVGSSLTLQDFGTFASMGGSQRSGVLAMTLKWITQMERT